MTLKSFAHSTGNFVSCVVESGCIDMLASSSRRCKCASKRGRQSFIILIFCGSSLAIATVLLFLIAPDSFDFNAAAKGLMQGTRPTNSPAMECGNFLGRSSSSWLNQPVHDDYINVKCDVHLGSRPKRHTPWMGTTCEPWLTRCAIKAIERVLRPTMHGLEWSCGSGTLWYLQHLASLHSIEHDEYYMSLCENKVLSLGEHLSNKWTPFHGSRNALVDSTGSIVPSEYISQAAKFERKTFDFIVIDGRNRTACLNFVLKHGLLREQDGILVLDNSERARYAKGMNEVPKHWHRYDFATPVDTTTIWISQLQRNN